MSALLVTSLNLSQELRCSLTLVTIFGAPMLTEKPFNFSHSYWRLGKQNIAPLVWNHNLEESSEMSNWAFKIPLSWNMALEPILLLKYSNYLRSLFWGVSKPEICKQYMELKGDDPPLHFHLCIMEMLLHCSCSKNKPSLSLLRSLLKFRKHTVSVSCFWVHIKFLIFILICYLLSRQRD